MSQNDTVDNDVAADAHTRTAATCTYLQAERAAGAQAHQWLKGSGGAPGPRAQGIAGCVDDPGLLAMRAGLSCASLLSSLSCDSGLTSGAAAAAAAGSLGSRRLTVAQLCPASCAACALHPTVANAPSAAKGTAALDMTARVAA